MIMGCLFVAASIVSVLINHGAATNIVNSRRELPHQCAQSRKVTSCPSSLPLSPFSTPPHTLSSSRFSLPSSSPLYPSSTLARTPFSLSIFLSLSPLPPFIFFLVSHCTRTSFHCPALSPPSSSVPLPLTPPFHVLLSLSLLPSFISQSLPPPLCTLLPSPSSSHCPSLPSSSLSSFLPPCLTPSLLPFSLTIVSRFPRFKNY